MISTGTVASGASRPNSAGSPGASIIESVALTSPHGASGDSAPSDRTARRRRIVLRVDDDDDGGEVAPEPGADPTPPDGTPLVATTPFAECTPILGSGDHLPSVPKVRRRRIVLRSRSVDLSGELGGGPGSECAVESGGETVPASSSCGSNTYTRPKRRIVLSGTPRPRCSMVMSQTARTNFSAKVDKAVASLPPDVHLVAADGSRHPAHRVLLSAWSPFFTTMFSSGMREQMTGEASFPDIAPEIVADILGWMYNREVFMRDDPPTHALRLLEVAQRWEIMELREQLSSSDAIPLNDCNIVELWQVAENLGIQELALRCQCAAMTPLHHMKDKGITYTDMYLPPLLKKLPPHLFVVLLASDRLPVTVEEHAFWIAHAYVKDRNDSLTPAEANSIYLKIRWRLMPGRFIAQHAMPIVERGSGNGAHHDLLMALADGMQFSLLGGQAHGVMKDTLAGRVRRCHTIVVPSFHALYVGMKVRIIWDMEKAKSRCKQRAPGAKKAVNWLADMKAVLGTQVILTSISEELGAAGFKSPARADGGEWWLPYNCFMRA